MHKGDRGAVRFGWRPNVKISSIDKPREKKCSPAPFSEVRPVFVGCPLALIFFPSLSRTGVIYEEGLIQAGLFLSIVNSQFTSV